MREHLFRECPIAKEKWEKLGVTWPIIEENTNFKEWFKNIFESNYLAKCRMIACALWETWTSRNRFIHEGEIKLGSQIADFVSNYLKELDGLNMNLPARRFHMGRWVALNGLRLKINFDVTFNNRSNGVFQALNLWLYLGLREVEIEGDSRSRESNKFAHAIAKEGLQKRKTTYLLNMVTSGAEEAVVADQSWTVSMRE
ncbi:hypothetical protein CXB51_024210 [Gossypium anomalum]|uniref:Uncharacterized protein n=1 Tax=Gossypium anomalum TaxID=47600 RepID=A0A8J6CUI3_9ROSI|nr:hypothetical protein CXB51_024210 [Gossypium anomalum]